MLVLNNRKHKQIEYLPILPSPERFNYESSLQKSPCNSTCPKECRTIEYISSVSEASFPNKKYQEYYTDMYGFKKSYIRYADFKPQLEQVMDSFRHATSHWLINTP